MQPRIILDSKRFNLTINRLCYQLIENHPDFSNSILIGVQPRGVYFSNRIFNCLQEITGKQITYGKLDVTFYRDDFRTSGKSLTPSATEINFMVENKNVILLDDVLFTGRTIRSAMDALVDFGRPSKVELMVLIDRRFTRQLPVQPDYVGLTIDSLQSEKVKVEWKETDEADRIWIVPSKTEKQ